MASVKSLRADVARDPTNEATWRELLGELKKDPDAADQVRVVYEDLLRQYPTAAVYWKEYCDFELRTSGEEAVKSLFGRCLLRCPVPELWRMYIRIIRKATDPQGPSALPEIRQALEFTLDRLGEDCASGPIWEEYLDLLFSPPPGSDACLALFGPDPGTRAAALRTAYQRALSAPHSALESAWLAYEAFEQSGSNRTLSKRALDEWRPRYHAARALTTERSRMRPATGVRRLPLDPGAGGAQASRGTAALAASWAEYVAWEAEDRQGLAAAALTKRVALAFEQALCALPRHVELWLAYAAWRRARPDPEAAAEAVEALRRGVEAAPRSLLLRLELAALLETAGDLGGAGEALEVVLAEMEAEDAAGERGDEDANARNASVPVDPSIDPSSPSPHPSSSSPPPPSSSTSSQPPWDAGQGTLAWIQGMRFACRAQGLPGARAVFKRARRWARLGWEAFAASAALEWMHPQAHRDQIARNIFELGLRRHPGSLGLVLAYVAFLRGAGDAVNVRALFERALAAATQEEEDPRAQGGGLVRRDADGISVAARPGDAAPTQPAAGLCEQAQLALWDAYAAFEAETGTAAAARAVADRRVAALVGRRARTPALALGMGAPLLEGLFRDPLREGLLLRSAQGLWPADGVQEQHLCKALGPVLDGLLFATGRSAGGPDGLAEGRTGSRAQQEPLTRASALLAAAAAPAAAAAGPREGGAPAEPIRQMPRELGALINSLPQARDASSMPAPDVERLVEGVVRADFSPAGIESHESRAAGERRRQRNLAGSAAGAPLTVHGEFLSTYKRPAVAPEPGRSDSEGEDAWGGGEGGDAYRQRRKMARVG